MTEARNGNITPEIQAVADYERIDVNKVLKKADELKISVTDVLNLIKECNL